MRWLPFAARTGQVALVTLITTVTLITIVASALAGCTQSGMGLRAPPIGTADGRSLLELQSLEAMESNETLAPPALHGATLVEVLALRRHLSPDQRPIADVWIADHVSLFGEVYARSTPAGFPRECPFRQAERAFAAWAVETRIQRYPGLLTKLLALPEAALPTLDRFALALVLLLHDPSLEASAGDFLTRSPERASGLAAVLKKRTDPALAETVFATVLAVKPASSCPTASWAERVDLPGFVRLWNATYSDPPTWEAGARAFAAAAPTLGDPDRAARAVLQEAWRIWPDRRAALLHIISSAADPARYTVEGGARRFEAEIGPAPTKDEAAAAAAAPPRAPSRALPMTTQGGGGPCRVPPADVPDLLRLPPLAGPAPLR